MIYLKPDSLTILLYHGVTKVKGYGIENLSEKHMGAKKFAEQMKFLKDSGDISVVSMYDVIDIYKKNKKIKGKLVAITFDDGFENNYSVAAPILDDYGLKATFYVSVGIINTNMMFWVDDLESFINFSKNKNLNVRMNNQDNVFYLQNKKEKYNTLVDIKKYCKSCSVQEKDIIMYQIQSQTKVINTIDYSLNYKKLTWRQLREMHSNSLFCIGGHGLYHDILSKLDKSRMEDEISLSIGMLNYNLNTKIDHYSYPEGTLDTFNDDVIFALKQNNIKCCPSAIFGFNSDTNLFTLNRNIIGMK